MVWFHSACWRQLSHAKYSIVLTGVFFSFFLGFSEKFVWGQGQESLGDHVVRPFAPPNPARESTIQYFGVAPEVTKALGSDTSTPATSDFNQSAESPYVGDEGIPVMAETVVEGESIDSFSDPFDEGSQYVTEDPWEPFNAKVFQFNYNVDRYFIKPVAKGYNAVVPPDVQTSLANAFDNMGYVPRLLNSLLQGKFGRAGIETQRFFINTTIGVGGLFDVAKYVFDTEAPPVEDTGQTLAVYGVKSGPYLVLPLLPPFTVRDAFGYVGDIFLNPINYFIPILPNFGINAEDTINDRSLNLERFQGIEESTVDLYGAVRSGYLQRRQKEIAR